MSGAIILIDMDGVLADWGGNYSRHLDERGAHESIRRHQQQQSFDLFEGVDTSYHGLIHEIMDHPGFYAELEPMDGAAQALDDMLRSGHYPFIVTSPWPSNPTCASDKLDWAERHIGKGWAKRTIITSDKTLVIGDYLIDDKPRITGHWSKPFWRHVLFDQPYNKTVDQPRMTHWSQWREFIE